MEEKQTNSTKKTTTAKPAEKAAPKTTSTAKPAEKAASSEPKAVASEKPSKKSGNGSAFKAKAAAVMRTDNFKIAAIIALACMFVLFLSLGLVLGLRNCSAFNHNPPFINAYATTTKVGYYAEVEGTIKRYRPVDGVNDERDAFPIDGATPSKRYPTYGSTPSGYTGDANIGVRNAVINESAYLCAWGTAGANNGGAQTPDKYTKIDKDGWLYQYKNNEWIHSLKWGTTEQAESNYRRLYKHTASVGLYSGDVADTEPGIVKKIMLRPRGYSSYSVTGLYAPAGEVIKIELSGKDMTASGGITVHIGQALYNGQANNIWAEKNTMPRMAHVLTTLAINKSTATYDEATDTWTGYIGSFLGGPIYIRNTSVTVTPKISGGVAYRHFILGYTTPEEFANLSKSTAPYFDLEVWEYGVLHSGPVRYAKSFSYDDLYKAAVLWEKVSTVTTTNGTKQGIVFLYDPFVAAGAAVAFPGRSSVNCPVGWMSQSLNYNSIVTSGSWGNFHEYHHNFQNYGLGSGADGEVTNNGLNLVSYSLFTKISSARRLAGFGGSGLSGWNQYTSASWVIQRVNDKSITSTNGLAIYATLLHNFGQDQYIKARGASGKNSYLNKWATNTHYDMTYFASKIADYGGGTYTPSQAVQDANYPLFVPVASVYQTGRSYNYDGEKRYIETMQPYIIPSGQPFTVDLNRYTVNKDNQYESGSVVIGDGFKSRVKSVDASKANGTFVKTADGVYTFTPNSETLSGKIYVTLEITTENGEHTYNGHALEDVDLVLEFQQSYEANKNVLERTTYFFTADTAYKDARAAYEAGYAGYASKNDRDHSNPTQNCNTDIWYCTENTIANFPKANPELDIVKPYSIDELRGKLYFPEVGKYNIYLRGRKNCAVYYSTDGGKTYQLGTYIADDKTGSGWRTDKYFTIDILEAESWIYIKEILINEQISTNMAAFIGLGIGQWTVPTYTTEVKYYTNIGGTETQVYLDTAYEGLRYYYEANNVKHYVEGDGTRYYYNSDGTMVSETRASAVEIRTIYKDASGNIVSEDKASNVTPVAPTSISYATAYRQSYEFQKQYESEYFYTRSYSYTYSDVAAPSEEASVLATENATTWPNNPVINMLYDNSSKFQVNAGFNSKKPVSITIDMGHLIRANRLELYGTLYNGYSYHPQKFYVLVGTSPDDITTPFGPHWGVDCEEFKSSTGNTFFSIDEAVTFRYYKIVIEKWSTGAVQFRYAKFSYVLPGTSSMITPDNAQFNYTGSWKIAQANSNFGHVYLASKGAEMSFEYEAKDDKGMFGILSANKFEHNFEIYVDGKLVETTTLLDNSNDRTLILTQNLSQGKHSVVIKCTGEANIDSVVFY